MSDTTNYNTSIALNKNWDIYQGADGNLAMLTGIEACQQDCKCALQAAIREMPYAYNQGMPFFDNVFNSVNLNAFVAAGRTNLKLVPGVDSVITFSASISDNALNYSTEIKTLYNSEVISVTGIQILTS